MTRTAGWYRPLGSLVVALIIAIACRQRPLSARSLSTRPLSWRPADSTELSSAQRQALYAAGLLPLSTDTAFEIARDSVGSAGFLFVRGTTGTGTGWYQRAFFILPVQGRTAVVWRAMAEDGVGDTTYLPGAEPYDLRGCLVVAGVRGVVYSLAVPPHNRTAAEEAKDSLALPSGLYEWRAAQGAFRLAAPVDSTVPAACT